MSVDRPAPEPAPVRAGLERLLRLLGAPPTDTITTVFDRWSDIVGEAVAAHATPVRIRDSVLHVDVSDPSWATELGWMRQDLVRKIHAATGDASITDLSFHVRG